MGQGPYFSAATNKYAYDQAYSRSALEHPHPSLVGGLWDRWRRRTRTISDVECSGPVELVPRS